MPERQRLRDLTPAQLIAFGAALVLGPLAAFTLGWLLLYAAGILLTR